MPDSKKQHQIPDTMGGPNPNSGMANLSAGVTKNMQNVLIKGPRITFEN